MLADPIRVFSSFSCDAPQEMNGKEGGRGGVLWKVFEHRNGRCHTPMYACMYVHISIASHHIQISIL